MTPLTPKNPVLRRARFVPSLAMLAVSFGFTTAASARPPSVVSASDAMGRITSLTPTEITVDGQWLPDWAPSNCTRAASSPNLTGFKVGDTVLVSCEHGVLTHIYPASADRLGPLTPVPGLLYKLNAGDPAPGPKPTLQQCADAWNQTVSTAAKEALDADVPLGAQIATPSGSIVSDPGSGSDVSVSGPSCQITFFLTRGSARIAIARSWWKNGTNTTWTGWIENENLEEYALDTPTNYTVSANGTLRKR